MAERVNFEARNLRWTANWGATLDPKSVTIVSQTREEQAEKEQAQVCLPIGPGAHDIIREELQRELAFANNLIHAIETDTVEQFEQKFEEEERIRIKVAAIKKAKKKTSAVKDLQKIKAEKMEEERILADKDSEEDASVETCKLCRQPKYEEGQVGMHRCKE